MSDPYTRDYRGHWCPFCNSYIRDLQGITKDIEAARGRTITVTSQRPDFLPIMRDKTGFRGQMLADPDHELAAVLRTRYGLEVAISTRKGYANGMAQPAVLVIKKDGTVLYKWAIEPGLVSHGGFYLYDNIRVTD